MCVRACVCVSVCVYMLVFFCLFCFVPSSAAKGKKHGRQQNKTNTHKGKKVQIYIKRQRWEGGPLLRNGEQRKPEQ